MTIDYGRLRELADKASPGPWKIQAEETSDCGDLIQGLAAWIEADNDFVFGRGMEIEEDEELTNLALAALAPDMARELLRLHRELRELRALMRTNAGYLKADGLRTAGNYSLNYAETLARILEGDEA